MSKFLTRSRVINSRLSVSRASRVVCNSFPNSTHFAVTVAASLILASPVLAEELNASQVYMQELQASILERTGKEDVLPELTEIPNEAAIQQEVDEALMQEVIAEQTAEIAEPVKASNIAEQAIKESVTAQIVTTGAATTDASKTPLEVNAVPAGGVNSTALGAVTAIGLAAVAAVTASSNTSETSSTAATGDVATTSGATTTPSIPDPAASEVKEGSSKAP
ncbi:hypothetical protein CEUSTIGMA_g2797.t1 [Chlamydomonas eustigma]|uniref:Uncharacterized protein n=1 Tax=Chlamydomonas eustigma TaxID=1157962 RepID=A0A250WWY3_9CHLO|nr:hypothetical protein CEUSTIGMA_g2797.t1 [Chlamydomonas eustigma]|eukprot:GAX75353.1 hypothetical protein CEUSTIGMA_g2797.t1 [Chlamydomonas eustigma]